MNSRSVDPVVHLELSTGNLPRACSFYTRLFGWRAQTIHVGSGSYLGLQLCDRIEGGVVERESDSALWLPYVQVADVNRSTELGQTLGASVQLEPREGPAGWRSVLEVPAGGHVALWQPKAQPPS